MHSSLSPVARRAGVLAAAALVCLTTACGPAELGLGAAGTAGPTSGQADVAGEPGAAEQAHADSPSGDEGVVPGAEAPAAVPPTTPPVDATAEIPPADTVDPAGDEPEEPVTELPTPPVTEAPAEPERGAEGVDGSVDSHVAPGAEQAAGAAGADRGRRSGTAPAAAATSAAVAPAAGGTAAGSGGSFTDQQRQSFTAGNGQTGRYLLYAAGIDPTRPVSLVVYADGTGEYGVDNPTSSYVLGGPSGLVANARSRNAITLAVESPNQACECWHTGDTDGYADFLADLVEKQLASYPIDEVWLTGFSSGAQEVTRFLVPRHPELLRVGGGWVLFGGGGPPAGGGAAVTTARMAGVRGHWYTGTADTAVPLTASWGAQAGERWYADRGVVTSHEWPAGVGHALDGRLGRALGQQLDAS